MLALAVLLLGVLGHPLDAKPLKRLGKEFRVNVFTLSRQYGGTVGSEANGDFVVIWASDGQDGSDFGIFGKRYASSGIRLGSGFRVNTYTSSRQWGASVGIDGDGDFVAVWSSKRQDGSGYGVFAQRYASSGRRLGREIQVNTYTPSDQVQGSVSSDPDGDFVVVWSSYHQDGSYYGIFAQRYASSGRRLGGEMQVNTYTHQQQSSPSISSDADGDFVVAWLDIQRADDDWSVFARRFASSGMALGGEFRVDPAFSRLDPLAVSIKSAPDGSFFVVWESEGIFGRLFQSSGAPLGHELNISTDPRAFHNFPDVSSDAGGRFVVVWGDYGKYDGYLEGIYGRHYASDGRPLGREFHVNTYTTGAKRFPRVSSDASGDFVVVWSSYEQDRSESGVYAQRFRSLTPAATAPAAPSILASSPPRLHRTSWALLVGLLFGATLLLRRRSVNGRARS